MKILTIRGKNLASLERFEVELESGPLEHVGIFAITGPTGAGKTTLLDALCVALFSRTPRLSTGGVPVGTEGQDESHRVRSNDVRGILRRGAGEGFAEVDFVGRDGRKYRARWSVHRSRRKASGKLQNSESSLIDLETEQVFKGKKNETLEAIEDKLGLSFEQFRRSALLAQNDFAAFLKADKELRSDLLERMTGTEIYTKVSMAAYRRAVAEEQSLSLLEESADSTAILGDEERAALILKRDGLREKHTMLRGQLGDSQAAVTWFEEDRKANASVKDAEAAVAEAKSKLKELGPTLERAAGIRRAREQRSIVDAATLARRQRVQASARQKQASEELEKATSRIKESEGTVSAAKAAVEAARVAYRRSLESERERIASRIQSLTDWIREHRDLAAAGGEVAEFAELAAEDLDALRPELKDAAEAHGREVDASRQRELQALEVRKQTRVASEEAQERVAAVGLAEIRKESALLGQQQAGLARLKAAVAALGRAEEHRRRSESEGNQATVALVRLTEEAASNAADVKACQASLQEAQTAYDRIRLALDLSEHRTKLVPGEHCPLCGSQEHPWYRDDATTRVVGEQEARVAALRNTLEERRREEADLAGKIRAHELARANAEKDAAARLEEALEAKRSVEAERKQDYFAELDRSLDDADLERTAKSIEARALALQERLSGAESLESKARELAAHANSATKAWEASTEARQEAEQSHQKALARLNACQGYRYRARNEELSRCRQAEAVCVQKIQAAPHWIPEAEGRELRLAEERLQAASEALVRASAEVEASERQTLECESAKNDAETQLATMLATIESTEEELCEKLAVTDEWLEQAESAGDAAGKAASDATATLRERLRIATELHRQRPEGVTEEEARGRHEKLTAELEAVVEAGLEISTTLKADEAARKRREELGEQIAGAAKRASVFRTLSDLIGSADGKKFRVFAQSLTLDSLLAGANQHLRELAPRYLLERVPGHDLDLQVIDRDLADEVRSVNSLSGGESFLISLALALGLSSLAARDVRVESLLVDEGFGSLDGDTLEVALSVLDSLQATGRKVGLISHVPGFAERIGAQVVVTPQGGGRSTVRIQGPGSYAE